MGNFIQGNFNKHAVEYLSQRGSELKETNVPYDLQP